MLIVTGACGFIGSNLVRALNRRGETDILAVDLRHKTQPRLLLDGAKVKDVVAADTFRTRLKMGRLASGVRGILHQGACADTMETDEAKMMDANVAFSDELLRFALDESIPFVYASSASVYGTNRETAEAPANEAPLNLYARSKLAFDNMVRPLLSKARSTVVGLRYFNVYGPAEIGKGRMASMVFQLYRQMRETGVARLFEGCDGFPDGGQQRDFVQVDDAIEVNLHFLDGPARTGIFNVGTGGARSFNEVAQAAIEVQGKGRVEYIPFPDALRGKYQSFTQADLSRLRDAGYGKPFLSLEEGVARAAPAWEREIDAAASS